MFLKEKVNTGRQLELDLARGLAVLFMIFIHAQLFFANDAVADSAFGTFNDFVGMVPSAPMFMFLLGVGINYTRKNDPKLFFKRGVMLILAGYLLNFLKGFVPCTINAYRTMDIYYLYEGIAELMYVDILHFSGLAMIMFGFFKRIRAKTWMIGFSSLIFAGINMLLLPVSVDHFWLSSITGLFWGSSYYSYFPFLTWAFYPLMGYVFGSFLIRCTNKKKFYALLIPISAIIFLGGTYLFNVWFGMPNGMLSEEGYYHHILTDNITFTALVILEIGLLFFITSLIPGFLEKIVKRWSKNVTPIFFIHWLIITWAALFIGLNNLNMVQFILLLIVIILTSDLLAYLYGKIKEESKESTGATSKRTTRFTILYIVMTVLVCVGYLFFISNMPSQSDKDMITLDQVENEDMGDYIYTGEVNLTTGEPNGIGKAYYSNGSTYEGEFKEGYRQGQGIYIEIEGESYKGTFVEDDYNGYGEYTVPNGSIYKGQFLNGEFHGQGTLINPDGSVESGNWNNGMLENATDDKGEEEDDE